MAECLTGRALLSDAEHSETAHDDEDIDIPDELEDTLGSLLDALQDKVHSTLSLPPHLLTKHPQDTIVRYSAAKALARVSERLPSDFVEQVLQQVLHLFTIHSLGAATLYDMPALAESTWHGAALACAELARRGLVADSHLGEVVGWMRKV